MIGEAIQQNPSFLQLRRIEASREVAKIVAKGSNRVILDSDSLMINFLGQQSKGTHFLVLSHNQDLKK